MSKSRLGRRAGVRLGISVLLLFLVPSRAWSEVIDEVEVGRFTLGIQFGYAQTKMTRFNENIDVVNHWLTHQGIPLREADRLKGSATARGEIRYKFGNRFSAGLGVGNAQAGSSFNVTFGDVNFFSRATIWSFMGYYHLPFVDNFGELADRMSIYVGAGPLLVTNASAQMRIADRSTEPVFDLDGDMVELDGEGKGRGTGAGLAGLAGASYQLNGRFSVAAEVGYRLAKVDDLELFDVRGYSREIGSSDPEAREPGDQAVFDFFRRDGRPPGLPNEDIEHNHIPYYSDHDGPMDLDFSGMLAQLAFRIHLF